MTMGCVTLMISLSIGGWGSRWSVKWRRSRRARLTSSVHTLRFDVTAESARSAGTVAAASSGASPVSGRPHRQRSSRPPPRGRPTPGRPTRPTHSRGRPHCRLTSRSGRRIIGDHRTSPTNSTLLRGVLDEEWLHQFRSEGEAGPWTATRPPPTPSTPSAEPCSPHHAEAAANPATRPRESNSAVADTTSGRLVW
jgi:hypothetical protein